MTRQHETRRSDRQEEHNTHTYTDIALAQTRANIGLAADSIVDSVLLELMLFGFIQGLSIGIVSALLKLYKK